MAWRTGHRRGRLCGGLHAPSYNGAQLMLWEVAILFLIVIAGTSGELCMSRAMKTIGEVKDFRPMSLLRVIVRAMQVGWMWIGFFLMVVAFLALLGALSMENVSFVVPVTAISYAAGALGGKIFLGERVSPQRWAGVANIRVCASERYCGKNWPAR